MQKLGAVREAFNFIFTNGLDLKHIWRMKIAAADKNVHWLKVQLAHTSGVLADCREKVRHIELDAGEEEWLIARAAQQVRDLEGIRRT